jgi:hypothetical protein
MKRLTGHRTLLRKNLLSFLSSAALHLRPAGRRPKPVVRRQRTGVAILEYGHSRGGPASPNRLEHNTVEISRRQLQHLSFFSATIIDTFGAKFFTSSEPSLSSRVATVEDSLALFNASVEVS